MDSQGAEGRLAVDPDRDGDEAAAPRSWAERYGEKHRWRRVADFPTGIAGPKRVRIYQRRDHYILQWWDRTAGRNLSARVDGDLVAAISRAREIEERLEQFRQSGEGPRRVRHGELVERFTQDLSRRADAGEIDPRTVRRYASALDHYVTFVEQPHVSAAYRSATQVDRDFALQFGAYLKNLRISPNGHAGAERRPMMAGRYVENVVRSMFSWGADPDRGRLFGSGFRNPFGGRRQSREPARDFLFGEPDVTTAMAAEFLLACDRFQLPLFATLMFCGLRAAEPCSIFQEHVDDAWLHVLCIAELDLFTKGRRDKRFPVIGPLARLLAPHPGGGEQGLLFMRRAVVEGTEKPPLLHAPLHRVVAAFDARVQAGKSASAGTRRAIRDQILHDAGALKYDNIEHEFQRLARHLNWPAVATLKDFRHLFSTLMQNAGMPEFYRRYLMGHSPSRAAISAYSHLNDLQAHYRRAVDHVFQPLVEAVSRRTDELGFPTIEAEPKAGS
ncbi:MAG: hypothetical protein HY290_03650 [Planctomycetia bacterium]|nr:hypothetical protein [Planctomycetia bacterium]